MAKISPDTVYVIYIATTPEKLWQALTSSEFTRQYFFGRSVECDWQVGSDFIMRTSAGDLDVRGKVIAADPLRLLTVTWGFDFLPEFKDLPETRVTFRIEPAGETCKLTMTETHAGPVDERLLEGGRQGWPIILSGLKSLLETGRVPAIPTPEPPKLD